MQVAFAALLAPCALLAQEPMGPPPGMQGAPLEPQFTIKGESELVLVNVTARDKNGNLVRGLKKSDFTVLEDGKVQTLYSFDVQDVAQYAKTGPDQAEAQGQAVEASLLTSTAKPTNVVRDRRLIVLMFDTSAMKTDELERAANSARKFLDKQMTSGDLVAIVTFDTSLAVKQDFTTDKKKLAAALDSIQGIEGAGLANGTTGSSDGTADTGGTYAADDTEYNTFNTDRRLQALASLAQSLAGVEQKKSVLYFSGGMARTGTENQAQLRAAINAAVKANMAIYPVDSRGLQALPPGGDATSGSMQGQGAYSGQAAQDQLDSNFSSQETLVTIASDTGGKAFLDTNDFTKAYDKVQADSETYYLIGYRSTNPMRDGRYRRITVKLNRADAKLDYRRGYYGPRDFHHMAKEDREMQLTEELMSELPNTELPVYLASEIFRVSGDRYYIPVSVVVPGSVIPFTTASAKDKASLDFAGLVREKKTKIPVGEARETVKLNVDGTQQVRSRNVQYNTGFTLPPGSYHLKFVVRENQNGRTGSFETDIVVPDMHKQLFRMSTVVLSSQKTPAPKRKTNSPLVANGEEIVPNVAHVFTTDRPMLFYYELYDPAKPKAEENKDAKTPRKEIRVLTSIQFFRGKVKAYETKPVETNVLSASDRKAVAFQLEVPLSELKPGWYTVQINLIDDAAGTFSFPRLPVLVRAPAEPAPSPTPEGAPPVQPSSTAPAPSAPPSR